jgi:hypothetical protein
MSDFENLYYFNANINFNNIELSHQHKMNFLKILWFSRLATQIRKFFHKTAKEKQFSSDLLCTIAQMLIKYLE